MRRLWRWWTRISYEAQVALILGAWSGLLLLLLWLSGAFRIK